MLHVKVPATSANMGSGFDSIGVALSLYNDIYVEKIKSGLEIVSKSPNKFIPTDKNNLIYKTICDFYDNVGMKVPPLRIIQEDNIPITRGLGSSAACIIGGLMIANKLSGVNYSKEVLADIAAKIEGHPDNSTPAILGGMSVGALTESGLKYVNIDMPENIVFAAMVPDFHLSTTASRGVLPKNYDRKDVVFNVSRAALLIASMMTGKYENLSSAMEDRIHQPYRKTLIKDMDNIFETAMQRGAKATYLSGAGSTLMAIITDEQKLCFENEMKGYLKTLDDKWELMILKPDTMGARFIND